MTECPPGFFVHDGDVCFKSEYRNDGKVEAFIDSGEAFCPVDPNPIVQPCICHWIDDHQ